MNGSLSRPAWLNLQGLLATLPLAVIYLLLVAVLKGLQLLAVTGQLSPPALVRLLAADLAVVLTIVPPLAVALSRLRGKLRAVLVLLYHAQMSLFFALAVATYGYFISTGANLSWSSILYWMTNYRQVSNVLSRESNIGLRFALAYGQFALVLVLGLLPWLPRWRERLARPLAGRWRALAMVGGGWLAALLLSLAPRPQGEISALAICVPVNILGDFVEEVILPEPAVEIAAGEVLDGSLELSVAPPSAPRPNIVLFIFESLRWKSSDAYIPGLETTPNLAALALKGQLIDFQYTTVPHTTKAVMPINCGIYPYLDTEPLEASPGLLPRRCLAHILGSQGYQSAFFQPAANFEKRERLVANMGYQLYRGLNDLPQEGFEETNYFGREERIMLQPSLDWVDSVRDRAPFLLTFLTLSTHHNYVTPQSFPYVEYDVEDTDLRSYLNAVRYTDDFLGALVAGFQERGLLENTVFIIVGDHGEAFGEHGGRQHDLIMWEEGLRSFGLLYAPGLLAGGGRIEGVRSHLDIVPTVVDLLGLQLTQGSFLGSSLLAPPEPERKLFHSCWYRKRCLAMRQGHIKTIYHYGLRPMEVYDNASDPFDLHNLAFQPPYDESFLTAREEELKRWVQVINQQYREWEERLRMSVVSEEEPPIANRLTARFGDAVELVGYEVEPVRVEAGRDLRVRYLFKVLAPLKKSDSFFVHLAQGSRFVNADHEIASGAHPLEEWQPGEYVTDEHYIHVPGNWPSGTARIAIGFWNRESRKRFPVATEEAAVDDQRLVVAEVQVQGARAAPVMTVEQRRAKAGPWLSRDPPPFSVAAGITFGDKVELVGYDLNRMDVSLAGTVDMTYTFKALADLPANWRLTVKLVREDGQATIDGDHLPIGGLYPPGDWQVGEYVRDRHRIHIDMHRSKPGTYGVWLGFAAGRRPAVPSPGLPVDEHQRVRVGTVTISPTVPQ